MKVSWYDSGMNWYFRYSGSAQKFERVEEPNKQHFGPRDVIVKPLISGVCGSDLSQVYHLKDNVSVGHEWVGEIQNLGSEVSGYKIGDLVSSVANVRCGNCSSCQEGRPEDCKRRVLLGKGQNSILSNQITLDHNDLVSIPEGLTLEDAVLLEVAYIGDCSYFAANRLGIPNNPKTLIFGAGPIGLFSALSMKHRDKGDITIVETIPERLTKAKALGFKTRPFAELVLDSSELNSYDLVIDCTGDHNGPGALKVLPLFPKEYGSVVIVGKYYQTQLQEKVFMGKALKLTWVANHKHSDFLESIQFWKDKISQYTSQVTDSFKIEDINEAYEEAKKRGTLKCLLKYD